MNQDSRVLRRYSMVNVFTFGVISVTSRPDFKIPSLTSKDFKSIEQHQRRLYIWWCVMKSPVKDAKSEQPRETTIRRSVLE